MSYRVMVSDGPAEGWSYVTSVPPDPVIAVAPIPREDMRGRYGGFMRVLREGDPWPGQVEYERGELPDDSVVPDADGDVVVRYRLLDASPSEP